MFEGRKIVFLRIFCGTLERGRRALNARTNKKEKVARLFRCTPNSASASTRRRRRDRRRRGPQGRDTGDTLCDPKEPILLERIDTYEPVISPAIEADNAAGEGEARLRARQDGRRRSDVPRARRTTRPARRSSAAWASCTSRSSSTAWSASTACRRAPASRRSCIRETVLAEGDGHAVFERDGRRSRRSTARRRAACAPRARGAGMEFKRALPALGAAARRASSRPRCRACATPRRAAPTAIRSRTSRSRSTSVALKDGANGEIGARAAAAEAFRRAVAAAHPSRLEPIMTVEVTVDDEFLGAVIGDLQQRRGQVQDVGTRGAQAHRHGARPAAQHVRLLDAPAQR